MQKLTPAQKETMKQLSTEAKTKDPALARELEEEYKEIEAQLPKTMQEVDKLKILSHRRVTWAHVTLQENARREYFVLEV